MTLVAPDWETARRAAYDSGQPLGTERLPLDGTEVAGLGRSADRRVLARDIVAGTPLPPFATSAMDGWAVAGCGPWRVVGRTLAGDRPIEPLREGEAVGIATGAEVPQGARGVLRSEHGWMSADGLLHAGAQPGDDAQPCGEVAAGQDVRPAGEEAVLGEVLVPAGTVLTPAHLGIAAAAGVDELVVVRRPTAWLLICGDELLRAGRARAGRIRDSLGPQLPAWLDRLGVRTLGVLRVADTLEAHLVALDAAADVDLVVTTGGTAAGPADHVHGAVAATGGTLIVDSVAVRPGHPMLLAGWDTGRRLLGLPGNPQAAVVALLTLGAPVVAAMVRAGLPELGLVPLAEPVARARNTRLVLARLTAAEVPGGMSAISVPFRGSGMLRGLGMADGLAVVPPEGAAAGSLVRWLPLPGSVRQAVLEK